MQKNKKKSTKNNTAMSVNLIGIGLSSLISVLTFILFTVIVSLILYKSEKISDNFIMHFYFCSVIPAFICGFTASKKCSFKGIVAGLISSVSFNFILTIILLFICNGKIRTDIGILFAVSTVFAILGGISGANTKRRK